MLTVRTAMQFVSTFATWFDLHHEILFRYFVVKSKGTYVCKPVLKKTKSHYLQEQQTRRELLSSWLWNFDKARHGILDTSILEANIMIRPVGPNCFWLHTGQNGVLAGLKFYSPYILQPSITAHVWTKHSAKAGPNQLLNKDIPVALFLSNDNNLF
jgi:hypothetical protein